MPGLTENNDVLWGTGDFQKAEIENLSPSRPVTITCIEGGVEVFRPSGSSGMVSVPDSLVLDPVGDWLYPGGDLVIGRNSEGEARIRIEYSTDAGIGPLFAVSSQLDHTGKERIHVSSGTATGGGDDPVPPVKVHKMIFLAGCYGDTTPAQLSQLYMIDETGTPVPGWAVTLDGVTVNGGVITGANVYSIQQMSPSTFAVFGQFLKLKTITLPDASSTQYIEWAASVLEIDYDGNIVNRNDLGKHSKQVGNSTSGFVTVQAGNTNIWGGRGFVYNGKVYSSVIVTEADWETGPLGEHLYCYTDNFTFDGSVKLGSGDRSSYIVSEKAVTSSGILMAHNYYSDDTYVIVNLGQMTVSNKLPYLPTSYSQYTASGVVAVGDIFCACTYVSGGAGVVHRWQENGVFMSSVPLASISSSTTEAQMAAYKAPYLYFMHLDIPNPNIGWRVGRVNVNTWAVDYEYSYNGTGVSTSYNVGFNIDSMNRVYIRAENNDSSRLTSAGAEDTNFTSPSSSNLRIHVAEWDE